MPREVVQTALESVGAECLTLMPTEGCLQRLSVKTWSHSPKM